MAERGPGTIARSLNLDKMELALDDKVVKVYRFADDPEMPWFQAKPISNYLEFAHFSSILDRVDADDKMQLQDLIDTKGAPVGGGGLKPPPPGNGCLDELNTLSYNDRKTIFINEPGLYSLILGSKKKEAREFKRWITHEVLPTLRRCGHYTVPGAEAGSSVYPLEHLQQIVSGLHQDLRKRDDDFRAALMKRDEDSAKHQEEMHRRFIESVQTVVVDQINSIEEAQRRHMVLKQQPGVLKQLPWVL